MDLLKIIYLIRKYLDLIFFILFWLVQLKKNCSFVKLYSQKCIKLNLN